MRKRFWVAMLAGCLIATSYISSEVSATSSSVVISHIQLGNSTSASHELIEVYNNTSSDVEVTNWCLYYASATSLTLGSKLSCFIPENNLLHIYVPAHRYALAISTAMATSYPTLGSDLKFSATLSGTAGHVRLIDSMQNEIDKVGWGITALSPETVASAPAPNEKVLERKVALPPQLQDTDNNGSDFEIVSPQSTYSVGSVYEVQDLCGNIDGIQQDVPLGYSLEVGSVCSPLPIDLCVNLDGVQVILPTQYLYDGSGLCQFDICPNLIDLQLTIPEQKEMDILGSCVDHDVCTNIEDIQIDIPNGYHIDSDATCMISYLPISINELLPNAVGDDDGHEYIEIYNPNDVSIDLGLYQLHIGSGTTKQYSFAIGTMIGPREYYSVSNDDLHFTLVNTESSVTIITTDGQYVDGPVFYADPDEGSSWARIDTIWQYTNRPTPGFSNSSSVIAVDDDSEEVVTGLKPCAPNQYRNLETNRCRTILTVSASLSACKVGQYRSEETNRCRSIASDAVQLIACDNNQERHPDTNRCRLLSATVGVATPCKENQERNPETNRCRTVVSTVPSAGFAVEAIQDTTEVFVGWWALGGIGLLALAYAGWEWRSEISRATRKLVTFFHHTK